MGGCTYCGGLLGPDTGEVDWMCPGCFHHCYYHHARLTYLNRPMFFLLFVLVVPLVVWLAFFTV